jgi:hypothetical protein
MTNRTNPPPPPAVARVVRFHRYQWIGVPLLLLAPPLLALAGVFGVRREAVTATSGDLTVTVEYPSRLRYRQQAWIRVSLAGSGADSTEISLDERYAEAFSDIRGLPELDEPYHVALAPGAQRLAIELKADRYGRHEGALAIRAGTASTRVPLRTTIFP